MRRDLLWRDVRQPGKPDVAFQNTVLWWSHAREPMLFGPTARKSDPARGTHVLTRSLGGVVLNGLGPGQGPFGPDDTADALRSRRNRGKMPVVPEAGSLEVAADTSLTLSVDHRVIKGTPGKLLAVFKCAPMGMLV
jgi:hypothetical protein